MCHSVSSSHLIGQCWTMSEGRSWARGLAMGERIKGHAQTLAAVKLESSRLSQGWSFVNLPMSPWTFPMLPLRLQPAPPSPTSTIHPSIGTIFCAERWCCLSSLLGYWVQSWTGRQADTGYQQAGTHFANLGRMTGRVNPTWN